jgi:hypothetical protein
MIRGNIPGISSGKDEPAFLAVFPGSAVAGIRKRPDSGKGLQGCMAGAGSFFMVNR